MMTVSADALLSFRDFRGGQVVLSIDVRFTMQWVLFGMLEEAIRAGALVVLHAVFAVFLRSCVARE